MDSQLADHRHIPRTARCAGFRLRVYAVCTVLPLLFVWRWVEETKGKTLEDMHSEALHH